MMNVSRARAATPGAAYGVHLDNAGAALMSRGVVDALVEHLRLEARIGGYEAAGQTEEQFHQVYDSIATMIGASSDEIAVVDNATVAWNLAFQSIPLSAGDMILTAEAEYATNYIMYLKAAQEHGVEVRTIPSDSSGQLDVVELKNAIDERTKLISITHVPTNGGLINPAVEIGAIARDTGVPFLLDACQSVGQLVVDVEELQCDLLSATGRKYLRGPRGTGFLYVRRAIFETVAPPVLDLHGATWVEPDRYELRPDARRYETWEFNHAGVLGLGRAVDEALEWGISDIEERVTGLGARLRTMLAGAGFETYDIGRHLSGIVTTRLQDTDAMEVRDLLFDRGINVSVTSPEDTLLDAARRGLPDLIRISPHYYNTEEELDRVVAALSEVSR